MTIHVKLFAVAKQLAGADSVELELPQNATVAELRTSLVNRLPELAAFGGNLRIAVNTQYVGDSSPIPLNAEVACIPPVSGG